MIFLVLLFLPIYFECVAFYDIQKRKLAFSVRLYKWIPVIGGYFATYKGGLAVHISEKNAILIPYKEWQEEQKRISIFRLFRLKRLSICLECTHESFRIALFLHQLFRIYLFCNYGKNKEIKNSLCINEECEGMKVSFYSNVSLNLYKLIEYILKMIKEKIEILWNKSKKKLVN